MTRFAVVEIADGGRWRHELDVNGRVVADSDDLETLVSQLAAKTGSDARLLSDGSGGDGPCR